MFHSPRSLGERTASSRGNDVTEIRQPDEQQPRPGGYRYDAPAGMTPGHPGSGPIPSPYGPWIPQQQGQWTPQAQGGWNPLPPPPPRNPLAIAALVVGIVTLVMSPVPFLNWLGILVGVVGTGLGVAALVVGLRHRVRVVMAAIALALSVLGVISAIGFTVALAHSLEAARSTSSASAAAPVPSVSSDGSSSAPAAAPTYTLSITGSAKKSSVSWGVDGSSGSADESTPIPWTRTMTGSGSDSYHYASLSAYTYPGTPGDLTCTITDQTGRVLDTKSAESQGGEYGSAQVMCSASSVGN
jgi:hypothetical protein